MGTNYDTPLICFYSLINKSINYNNILVYSFFSLKKYIMLQLMESLVLVDFIFKYNDLSDKYREVKYRLLNIPWPL